MSVVHEGELSHSQLKLLAAFGGSVVGWKWDGNTIDRTPKNDGVCSCGHQNLRWCFRWVKAGEPGVVWTGSQCFKHIPGLDKASCEGIRARVAAIQAKDRATADRAKAFAQDAALKKEAEQKEIKADLERAKVYGAMDELLKLLERFRTRAQVQYPSSADGINRTAKEIQTRIWGVESKLLPNDVSGADSELQAAWISLKLLHRQWPLEAGRPTNPRTRDEMSENEEKKGERPVNQAYRTGLDSRHLYIVVEPSASAGYNDSKATEPNRAPSGPRKSQDELKTPCGPWQSQDGLKQSGGACQEAQKMAHSMANGIAHGERRLARTRREQRCSQCLLMIPAGSEAFWLPHKGSVRHTVCPRPRPTMQTASPPTTSSTPANSGLAAAPTGAVPTLPAVHVQAYPSPRDGVCSICGRRFYRGHQVVARPGPGGARRFAHRQCAVFELTQ